MQGQTADFSRLPLILKSIIKALEELKEEKADWCSRMLTQVDQLEIDHGMMITMSRSARSFVDGASVGSLTDYRDKVALPYVDALLHNIGNRFSGEAVDLLVSSSVFNPASLHSEEAALPDYGKREVEVLAQFYGNEAIVVHNGVTFSSPPLIDKDEIAIEWRLFKRALIQESRLIREKNETTKTPSLQDVKVHMESSGAYT
ncbi:hypothetical protein LOD99_15504 [Oopsacas minuta]|uniref:Uncharacterized protein n=1 Tax=Oopsacas minuta TaxID=111878 RepID=A0AAV7KBD1_9METZ|nr:hypothetical protein LOD99_15504 [Oopsacas minuta]